MSKQERKTAHDLDKLNVPFSREATQVLSEFLKGFCTGYPRDMQGPIHPLTLLKFDEISDMFEQVLSNQSTEGRVSLSLNFLDVEDLGTVVYFIACGGEREIIMGEKSTVPSYPVDLAFLDLNEAFVKAGGKDSPNLRNRFEALGK